jgi:PelA/Pel-15E family pectate lyase
MRFAPKLAPKIWWLVLGGLAVVLAGGVVIGILRTRATPQALWRKTPGEGAKAELLAPERVARLPRDQRAEWERYIERSQRTRARDQDSMARELEDVGATAMTRAPHGKGFRFDRKWTREWFGSAEARRLADSVLSFQTPSGGWSKRVDMTRGPRRRGQSYFSENDRWSYIATLDNDATISQLRFLAAVHAAHPEARLAQAFERGIEYLLEAQFPNGCWPQVYPLAGGYHDGATFNDDAIVNVARLLGEVAGGAFGFVAPERRQRARAAADRGVECILASQVLVRGTRTVWAQQYDPLTLQPAAARTYELVGLSGRESANATRYLMSLPTPNPRVVSAVLAAVDWFRAHALSGHVYDDYVLRKVDGAGPLWARLTEIATDRPIFSNRDGVKLYDWNKLTDRRRGYGWFGDEPAAVLAEYPAWVARVGGASGK